MKTIYYVSQVIDTSTDNLDDEIIYVTKNLLNRLIDHLRISGELKLDRDHAFILSTDKLDFWIKIIVKYILLKDEE